jgi:hypothetical protein
MPVPMPQTGREKLDPPDAAEARLIAGAVAGATSLPEGLTHLQRLMIEAITESMTGFAVPATAIPRLSPEEFAHAMRDRNEGFRSRMVQFMLLSALVLNPLPEPVVSRIDRYADELGVRNDMLRVAHQFARGSFGLALVDFQRSGYMETWDASRSAALHTSHELAVAWEQCVHDDALARRWMSLADLPADTLGHRVSQFYEARGFAFPGQPGSAPPLLAQHDWVHVLTDYGSTVESEIEVFAFITRANDDPRAFSLLAQIVSLFETGYAATGMGLFEYDRGHLSHEGMAIRLADAMRRGARSATIHQSTDFLSVDWFEHAELTIDEARAHFGIEPKASHALSAGSVSPWERGGISEYQFGAGRAKAESLGRPYDSFGASPQ